MKILITGGAGFIGSHLARRFHNRAEVRILDNLRTGRLSNLAGLSVEIFEGSILDYDLLQTALSGVELVFHLAAFVSVPDSMAEPRTCEEINVIGSQRVLEASVKAGVSRLCFSSSASVYGNQGNGAVAENSPLDPGSPYAQSKIRGEELCREFHQKSGLRTVALRFFNAFGPRQSVTSGYSAAVPFFIKQALAGGPLTIFGQGLQTRDFVYVEDIVAALSLTSENRDLTGVFNVGYGSSISVLELAKKVIHLAESKSSIGFRPSRPGDLVHSCADITKLSEAGFHPRYTVTSGLEKTIRATRFADSAVAP